MDFYILVYSYFCLQLSLCIAKSHLKSYPCPKNFNYLWNQGFLIILAMLLQILTGILLGLHYTSEMNKIYDFRNYAIGSVIYTSSNQAIAISKSNNPLNMCLFITLFNSHFLSLHAITIALVTAASCPISFL